MFRLKSLRNIVPNMKLTPLNKFNTLKINPTYALGKYKFSSVPKVREDLTTKTTKQDNLKKSCDCHRSENINSEKAGALWLLWIVFGIILIGAFGESGCLIAISLPLIIAFLVLVS